MTNHTDATIVCSACRTATSGNFCHNCGAVLANTRCRQCNSELAPDARFCNDCGASTERAPTLTRALDTTGPRADDAPPTASPTPSGVRVPWILAGASVIALTVYFSRQSSVATPPAEVGVPSAPFAATASGGAAPDISQMTPRERASRLYTRVMRYASEGKADSVLMFVPMAMTSFEMLGADLDAGTRYDYGRVAIEAGDFAVAAAQADTILRQAPDHLLGLALQARSAKANGNAGAATKALTAFARVLDTELKKKLPEYEQHAADIEQTKALAASR